MDYSIRMLYLCHCIIRRIQHPNKKKKQSQKKIWVMDYSIRMLYLCLCNIRRIQVWTVNNYVYLTYTYYNIYYCHEFNLKYIIQSPSVSKFRHISKCDNTCLTKYFAATKYTVKYILITDVFLLCYNDHKLNNSECGYLSVSTTSIVKI